ncbi:hypothetical protein [Streptomyces sp. NPDC048639]|uniref:hypothetical protein n=1 Tax=Streptomyces sp. NPDC048639 TaxID=3365581 RepID=UPI0037165E96
MFQQNIANSSRQNNSCNNPNVSDLALMGGRAGARCGSHDGSFSKHTQVKGGSARAEGGSSTGFGVTQQNLAQEGRQNNNCSNPNSDADTTVTGGRLAVGCGNKDGSFSKHTLVEGGSARAEGGSADFSVFQQNSAQDGRQNNSCHNPNASDRDVSGGRVGARCGNHDGSFSEHTRVEGGGARAEGGSSTGGEMFQQNVAQEGRQNNTCTNPNLSTINVSGGRVDARCATKDFSFSKHTQVKGGGARADGGSSTTSNVVQQNVAQEGRQNNNCHNPNSNTDVTVSGGRVDARCTGQDFSFSKHTQVKGDGARADGGSAAASAIQQDVAQEGRQNNNCNSPTEVSDLDVSGGRVEARCGNKDRSFSEHTRVEGGGARADGGSSTAGSVAQQDVAQEGRQNNNCHDPNSDSDITVTGGRLAVRCENKDRSLSKHTQVKGGGAGAEGGSAAATVSQQNVAQAGRQNNNCHNPNASDLDVTGGRVGVGCKTVDHSANLGTAEIGGGAQAEGGSSTGVLFQQNVAQEGRQNNNCNNSNNVTLTATGANSTSQCRAVDNSRTIGSLYR